MAETLQLSELHWTLGYLAKPACALALSQLDSQSYQISLSSETPRRAWHFVEHSVHLLWARPDRAVCTRRHRATAAALLPPPLVLILL